MKSINDIIKDQTINEGLELLTITQLMFQISMLMLITASTRHYSGEYSPSILDKIKGWWKDKKASKIIKRLAEDTEVQDFLKQSYTKQQSGWRDLIKTKLNDEEREYIYRITKNKVSDEINK